ncbi:hypothetical protein ACWC2T_12635 [Streptomyces sp. NPDC001393]
MNGVFLVRQLIRTQELTHVTDNPAATDDVAVSLRARILEGPRKGQA